MQDIYDIKSVMPISAIDYNLLIILLILFTTLIIIYWLYKKYIYKKAKKNVKEIIKEEEKHDITYFIDKIDKLIRNLDKYSDKEFLDKLNDILRGCLETIGIKLASKMTIQEMEDKIKDDSLLSFLKEIYFVQFDKDTENKSLDKQSLAIRTRQFIINLG